MPQRWLIAGLALLTAAALHSVDSRPAVVATGATTTASGSALAGLRVAVDPATGAIVAQPTADDLSGLGALGRDRRRADELETFDLPGGARGVVLDRWADHALRVERDADGVLRLVCARGDRHREAR